MKAMTSLILGLSIFISYPLLASEESHREAAKQMVEVANLDKMLSAMYQQINTVITQNILAKDPCLESIRAPLTALLTKYDQKILNADVVKTEIQKVYQAEFSEEEIKQIVAFYKTPAGQKALEKAPILAAKGMEIAQKEIDKSKSLGVMDDLQKDINALIDNIDVKTLSPECKKKFEEKKAVKGKLDEEKSKAESAAAAAAGAAATGSAAAVTAAPAKAEVAKPEAKPEAKATAKSAKVEPKKKAKKDSNNKNGNGKKAKDGKDKKEAK